MYKYILESANDINWMAILPLIIFFSFFTITLIATWKKNKGFIDRMKHLPLDNDN
ncbi:MAG: cytochrome C oxidase Cbb3 [Saprospiraceae bacterium]